MDTLCRFIECFMKKSCLLWVLSACVAFTYNCSAADSHNLSEQEIPGCSEKWTDELGSTLALIINGFIAKGAESTLIRIESTHAIVNDMVEWIERSITENPSMLMVSNLCEKQREANVIRARADAEFQKAESAYNGLKSLSMQAQSSFWSIVGSPLLSIKNVHEQEKEVNDTMNNIMREMNAIEKECNKIGDDFIVESSMLGFNLPRITDPLSSVACNCPVQTDVK
jgi:hypothetical protein